MGAGGRLQFLPVAAQRAHAWLGRPAPACDTVQRPSGVCSRSRGSAGCQAESAPGGHARTPPPSTGLPRAPGAHDASARPAQARPGAAPVLALVCPRTCARPSCALTRLHGVQGTGPATCMRTRYAADFTDPGGRPALAAPSDLTPAATTRDLAAGTVRGGRHTRRAGPAALRLAAAPFHASWKCSTPGMPRFMSSSGSSVQATAALCPRLQTGSTDKGLDSQGSAHRCRQTCCCSPWTSTRAGAHPVLRNTPRRQAHAAALWAVFCALNPISLHMPDSALRQVRFGCACRHLPHYTGHRPQAARNIRLL